MFNEAEAGFDPYREYPWSFAILSLDTSTRLDSEYAIPSLHMWHVLYGRHP